MTLLKGHWPPTLFAGLRMLNRDDGERLATTGEQRAQPEKGAPAVSQRATSGALAFPPPPSNCLIESPQVVRYTLAKRATMMRRSLPRFIAVIPAALLVYIAAVPSLPTSEYPHPESCPPLPQAAEKPDARPSLGMLLHRGRCYDIRDLMDPEYRAASNDDFVRDFDSDRMITQWAGTDASPEELMFGRE